VSSTEMEPTMTRPQHERLLWLNAVAAGNANDCHRALGANISLLLQGPAPATTACIALLIPDLIHPVVRRSPRAPLKLPTAHVGALVLEDVVSLTSDDQIRLMDWFDARPKRTQIVCTAAGSLFAAVLHGVFAETLYYRLNGVLIDITVEALRAVVNEAEGLEHLPDAMDGKVRQSA
jgi:hypothetical protein